APMSCSRINFASSLTGVSGLTQSTPLCMASLTFMADLRCWSWGALDERSAAPPGHWPNHTTDRLAWHEALHVSSAAFDLKFLTEFAATAVGTSNRRH